MPDYAGPMVWLLFKSPVHELLIPFAMTKLTNHNSFASLTGVLMVGFQCFRSLCLTPLLLSPLLPCQQNIRKLAREF